MLIIACDVYDQNINRITIIFPPIPKDKTIIESTSSEVKLFSNGHCFIYDDFYAKMYCYNDNYMIEGIDNKYFKGNVEFFNLTKYENDFESDSQAAIEKVKLEYKSNREKKYNTILELLNDLKEIDEAEYNEEDEYDELYKGNGYCDGESILISHDKILIFSSYYTVIYNCALKEDGDKTNITLGDIDEEKTYIDIDSNKVKCNIESGKYSYKIIKEKCPDEYQTILDKAIIRLRIPDYISNNKLYYVGYSEYYSKDLYELSNADIHYKIDHPHLEYYPVKQYEMWGIYRVHENYESGDGIDRYILQTNSSIFSYEKKDDEEKDENYIAFHYIISKYYINHNNIEYYSDSGRYLNEMTFFHLEENDSRICYEGGLSNNNYLLNECYKVRSIYIYIILYIIINRS